MTLKLRRNPPDTRHAIENLLATLGGIRSSGIIVTMRGTEKPHGLQWSHPQPLPLEPLEDGPALALFQAISHCSEDGLSELLKDVDNIPLAIKLLGRLVEEEGLAYVLREWKRDGLKVVDCGDASDTRTTSVTASIDLSLSSPHIASIPYIYEVFAILSILPDGLSESMIDALEARLPAGVDLRRVLRALRRIALCYLDSNGRYRLLAPIRQHVQRTLSLDPGFLDGMRSTFLEHVIDRTDIGYHDIVVPEMVNIRSFIVSESTMWDDSHILACLDYLWWEDRILGIRDIPLALIALSHAHTPRLQVRCRLRISSLLGFSSRYGEAREYLTPALSVQTGDPYVEGCVRLEMGEIERMLNKYEDAESFLRQAVRLFKEANMPKWEGVALGSLGTLLRGWGHIFKVEEPLIQSLGLARKAGDTLHEGNALCGLGEVYWLTKRMSEAEDTLRQSIDCYRLSHCDEAPFCLVTFRF